MARAASITQVHRALLGVIWVAEAVIATAHSEEADVIVVTAIVADLVVTAGAVIYPKRQLRTAEAAYTETWGQPVPSTVPLGSGEYAWHAQRSPEQLLIFTGVMELRAVRPWRSLPWFLLAATVATWFIVVGWTLATFVLELI